MFSNKNYLTLLAEDTQFQKKSLHLPQIFTVSRTYRRSRHAQDIAIKAYDSIRISISDF